MFPPGPREPQGIHGAVWEYLTDHSFELPRAQPQTVASYEVDLAVRAYVVNFALGEALAEVPLFLEPGGCVEAPLEATYARAFDAVPKRWRNVLANAER